MLYSRSKDYMFRPVMAIIRSLSFDTLKIIYIIVWRLVWWGDLYIRAIVWVFCVLWFFVPGFALFRCILFLGLLFLGPRFSS